MVSLVLEAFKLSFSIIYFNIIHWPSSYPEVVHKQADRPSSKAQPYLLHSRHTFEYFPISLILQVQFYQFSRNWLYPYEFNRPDVVPRYYQIGSKWMFHQFCAYITYCIKLHNVYPRIRTHCQCDQIGLLLKSLGDIFSYKISPNIEQLYVLS